MINKKLISEDGLHMDQMAESHFQHFLNTYNLKSLFRLEHKPEHFGMAAATIQKANYMILTLKGNVIAKVRGLKPYDPLNSEVTYDLLKKIVANNVSKKMLPYKTTEICLTTGKTYLQSVNHSTKKVEELSKDHLMLPGFPMEKSHHYLVPLSDRTIPDLKTYRKIKKAENDVRELLISFLTRYSLEKVLEIREITDYINYKNIQNELGEGRLKSGFTPPPLAKHETLY